MSALTPVTTRSITPVSGSTNATTDVSNFPATIHGKSVLVKLPPSLTPPPRFVGQRTALVFTLEAARGSVARAEIRVAQGASSVVVAKREGALGRRVEIPVVLESATLGLREG